MQPIHVKICRVLDIYTARYLARCGVDFIGLHAIFELPERDKLQEYGCIISELRSYYPKTKTVLVTRVSDVSKLLKLYAKLPTDFVQISAHMSFEDKTSFIQGAKSINKNVNIFNVLSADDIAETGVLTKILGKSVIIDKNFFGGTGTQIERSRIKEILPQLKNKYILLAGGMGRIDARKWLLGLGIAGVDIMSSMEFGNGDNRKDIEKIISYLKNLKKKVDILGEFTYIKKITAIYADKKSFSFNKMKDRPELLLYKFTTPEALSDFTSAVHAENNFIPITVVVDRNSFSYIKYIKTFSCVAKNNINAICFYPFDLLENSDQKISKDLKGLEKKVKLGLCLNDNKQISCLTSLKVDENISDFYINETLFDSKMDLPKKGRVIFISKK